MFFSSKLFSYDPILISKNRELESAELFQVSELSLIRSGEIHEHIQICDELTYAVSGKAEVYSDGECSEISGGQIHFVKKGVSHRIVASGNDNFRYICIGFCANDDCDEIKTFTECIKDKVEFIVDDVNNVKSLFDKLLDEFYIADENTETMLNLYMKQILISVARVYIGEFATKGKESTSTSNFVVYSAIKYIDRNYLYITEARQVSEALSYSEFYISHLFKEKVGMNIKEYLMKKKLASAAQLLSSGNLKIGEISDYLNFGTTHTFSQAFKRYYGVSPAEYKKLNSKF